MGNVKCYYNKDDELNEIKNYCITSSVNINVNTHDTKILDKREGQTAYGKLFSYIDLEVLKLFNSIF